MKRLNLVLSLLLDDMKIMTDEERDTPMRWNIMHMYSCAQLAKLLALHRGIDPELAGIAAALHDTALVRTGKRKNHAQMSAPYIYEFVNRFNNGPWTNVPNISTEETDSLVNAITSHSQKEVDSGRPLNELLKDADALDRYLHGVADSRHAYIERYKRVLEELGIRNK